MENSKDDVLLIQRIKSKDESALSELIEKYGNYVYQILYNLLHIYCPAEDIEELMADVFISLWNNAGKINTESYTCFKGYLGAIARNKGKNHLKKNKLANLSLDDDILIISNSIEQNILKNEQQKIIYSALGKLKKIERIVLISYYYDYKKVAQIAAELNINPQTVKTHLARGRKMLKKLLEKERMY